MSPFVAALVFMSGASALVYETVWLRQAAQAMGQTAAGTTAVLAAWMGGLGLGAALMAPRADRATNDGDGALFRVKRDLSSKNWSRVCNAAPLYTANNGFFKTPVLGADGVLYAVLEDGLAGNITLSPRGLLYFVGDTKQLYAIHTTSPGLATEGWPAWRRNAEQTGSAIEATP